MKFHRSTKCSLKFATKGKRQTLLQILEEYGRVCNFFIQHFWEQEELLTKNQLTKEIVNLPTTWLSHRLCKVAAREALDMINSTRERWKHKPNKMKMPVHKGRRMAVSSTIADLRLAKQATNFDAWLHLASIGNKTILDLPIKFHKHFHRWNSRPDTTRLNSYIITDQYVQFCFETKVAPKRTEGALLGIDTGIKSLATLSNGEQFGRHIEQHIEAINRCQQGSKSQQRRRRALKQYINEVTKEVVASNPQLIVVEKLNNLNYKTRVKRRLTKNMRRSLGSWNYRYWLVRLQQATEVNRIAFRQVSAYYTSQRCSKCGHTERSNRLGECFKCVKCGYLDHADKNAASNILDRFLQGPYGALYKPKLELGKNVQV